MDHTKQTGFQKNWLAVSFARHCKDYNQKYLNMDNFLNFGALNAYLHGMDRSGLQSSVGNLDAKLDGYILYSQTGL